MTARRFQPGIATLLESHPGWIRGKRVALVSHAAALSTDGCHALDLLLQSGLPRRVVVWGPEHGFFSTAGAGESVGHSRHPLWGVPVYSLYGEQRRPTPAMLRAVDIVVLDLQDLAVRCYTYASTLRFVLEAAAEAGRPVVVADRPVPFPDTVDGPMLTPACTSFVGAIPAPLVYGMTPGECALWLQRELGLDLDLRVAAMRGYHREPWRGRDWPSWIPPSPGIATWESAWCYPATVFTEALPALDCARASRLPFQSLSAPWIEALPFARAMQQLDLPGVSFHPHLGAVTMPGGTSRPAQGVRITVTDAGRYRPVLTSVALLHVLQERYGRRRVWPAPRSRPEFFDKLFGTDAVRRGLRDGVPPAAFAATWARESAAFRRARAAALLYGNTP